ncbi:hypothetical protein BDV24DRAFT_159800 [Aspergillus arachidicola]|uniref:Uncharacterized protein n=1 Tax=Aspergillus arachidicola TaxID=656916 RepID=A0A5N6YHI1_9EURO|nr:hypothetical protein BDV24DRAFT_159800 [Aspergillus arachidicola]
MSPSTETLPQYDLERGQGVKIELSQINSEPPLYVKRCPNLHSPPSYTSQDQEELEAHKVGDKIVETTGAILRAVSSIFKQILKIIATRILEVAENICILVRVLTGFFKRMLCAIFHALPCILGYLLGLLAAGVVLGGIVGLFHWGFKPSEYRWVWVLDATVPDKNCTWYFNNFKGPESVAYHWLWAKYKSFKIHEGRYNIALHPDGKPIIYTVNIWPNCTT